MLSQEAQLDALCDPMTRRATFLRLRGKYQSDKTGKSDLPMELMQELRKRWKFRLFLSPNDDLRRKRRKW